MKNFIAKYQKAIVGTGAVAVLLICYFQQKELAKLRSGARIEVLGGGDIAKVHTIDSLQTKIDSLQSEIFIRNTIVGRYEVAFQLFMERNPEAAKQYGTIISNETE